MHSRVLFAYDNLPPRLKAAALEAYIRLMRVRRQIHYLLHYGTTDFFETIEIEINTSCNRRCNYCPNSIFDRSLIENEKFMPTEVFRKVVDELAEIGYDGEISPHLFGEPLLDNRLPELIRYARDNLPKARIIIFSNGDLLDKKRYQMLCEAGVSEFRVTQHGKTMPLGIKELLSLGAELDAPISYNVLTEFSNRGGLIDVDPAAEKKYPNCFLYESLIIDYAGNAILCCDDYHSSIIFGNIAQDTLLNIWENKKYKKLRKRLRKRIYDLPICQICVGR
jgi:hypothetical protein